MRILLVDDDRNFTDGRDAVVTRTSGDGFVAIQDGHYDQVWLDYVLLRRDTTLELMFAIQEFHRNGGARLDVDEFIIHSDSSDAHELLEEMLNECEQGYKVTHEWNPTTVFTRG